MKLNGTLLIVDDCVSFGEAIAAMLQRQGFKVKTTREIWNITGVADQAIIKYAHRNGCIVLTNNEKDFNALSGIRRLKFAFGSPGEAIRVLYVEQDLAPVEVTRRMLNFSSRMAINPQVWDKALLKGHGVIKLE